MKRTYGYEMLCEILQDHETMSTGAAPGYITQIDMFENNDIALVVTFSTEMPSAEELRDAQQELDLNANDRDPQSKPSE